MTTTDKTRIPVAFIGGHGHSGSTLISRILGGIPGFFAVGELSYIWTRGVLRNEPCGCGERFHDCDFWRSTGKHAFGGWDRVDVPELLNRRARVARVRHLPLLAAPHPSTSFRRRLSAFTETLAQLYSSIRDVSGCEIIIDSSKYPTSAYPLRRTPGIEMRMIHLVRSSQGVCYSFQKSAKAAHDGDQQKLHPSPGRVAVEWMAFNFMLDTLRMLGTASMLLRYEDFIANPERELSRMVAFLGQDRTPADFPLEGQSTVVLPRDHSVAGNPMRIRTGRELLSVDERWRVSLSPRNRRLVTAITSPGLLRYGYPVTNPVR